MPDDMEFSVEQESWLHLLETYRGPRTRNQLFDPKTGGYCALGLACQMILGDPELDSRLDGICASWDGSISRLPEAVQKALKLRNGYGAAFGGTGLLPVTVLSDTGFPFPEIAALLRSNKKEYFRWEDEQ